MRRVVVVLGMSGSGKTTYTESLGCPVLHLDEVHDYAAGRTDYRTVWDFVLANLAEDTIAMDGWFFKDPGRLPILQDLLGFGERTVEVHAVYTDPLLLYEAQIAKEAAGCYRIPDGQRTPAEHARVWGSYWQEFVEKIVDGLEDCALVSYQCRNGDSYSTGGRQHSLETAAADPVSYLLSWIDATSHDPSYQTIELDGRRIREGYSESYKTWEQMQQWGIDWHRPVVDIGCFHGYFSFKAEECGATVSGYDADPAALAVANRLATLRRSACRFSQLDLATDAIPIVHDGVLLCLNVLHHVKGGPRKIAPALFTATDVVAEVEPAELSVLNQFASAGYSIENSAPSHRTATRRLVHYRRIQ